MSQWVEVAFDCLPLRSIQRLDIPLDASPIYRQKLERIKAAIERHGTHNTYYLHNARCVFHVTNAPDIGLLEFRFEGTVFTDERDRQAQGTDLDVELIRETCQWLTEPVVKWFEQTVASAVQVEFNRYIAAGDLEKTRERLARMQAESEASGGFVGLYL